MITIAETATRLIVDGDPADMAKIQDRFKYRPDKYFMSPRYQIWKRHQKKIADAWKSGAADLAQSLEKEKVGWDGWVYLLKNADARKADLDSKKKCLDRGHKKDLLSFCDDFGIEVDDSKILPNPFEGVTLDDIPDNLVAADLDESQWNIQKRCILAWISNGMARNTVTVSGGKTIMFCAAMAYVKTRFPQARFLYLTPTERLCSQVYSEAKRLLPDWNISQFGGPGRDPDGKDLVVCTGAILGKRFLKLVANGWFKTFMGLSLDECQYSLSPTWSKVIRVTPAYFRFAASDTAREDHEERSLQLTGLCGPVFETVEMQEMLDIDRVASPTVEIVTVKSWENKFVDLNHEAEIGTAAWIRAHNSWVKGTYLGHVYELDEKGELRLDKKKEPIVVPGLHRIKLQDGSERNVESRWCLLRRRYDTGIIRFKERNDFIVARAKEYSDNGWPTLVVATRTLHVMILESMAKSVIDPNLVQILYSTHDPETRDRVFNWLKTTPGAVLISPLVKVGVSINEIRAGIIADRVGDWEMARQLIGRFIRKKPDGTPNEARITWFCDVQHPSFKRSSLKLFSKLKSIRGIKWEESSV